MVGASGSVLRRIDVAGGEWPFPGGAAAAPPSASGILPLDWNSDFRTDLLLAGQDGVRLLLQGDGAAFADATEAAWGGATPAVAPAAGAWAADLEMDGDLDAVVGLDNGAPLVLRNNGDGTWAPLPQFETLADVRAMVWGDLDRDGDPDPAFLDAAGALHVFDNRQAGQFDVRPAPGDLEPWVALAVADSDGDGRLELLGLDTVGAVSRFTWEGDAGWDGGTRIVTWQGVPAGAAAGGYRLWLVDLDNSGGLDVAASGGGTSRVWLADAAGRYAALAQVPRRRDLRRRGSHGRRPAGPGGSGGGRSHAVSRRGCPRLSLARAAPRARSSTPATSASTRSVWAARRRCGRDCSCKSSFSRAARCTSAWAPARTSTSHAFCGRTGWPRPSSTSTPTRRSSPSNASRDRAPGCSRGDGTGMRFVTDFLWRSPLGLRINAQDTAGVVQTEDWVKIRGDQLVPRDGVYDVRITAELWETLFFDHVSLLVIDHPAEVDVYVDERFSVPAPDLDVRTTTPPQAVAAAWDDAGRDVTDLVREQDGRYLDTFALGRYQGVTAGEHAVEFVLGGGVPATGPIWLLAYGWIYPTDSSINVALGQGNLAPPRGLALDVLEPSGAWRTVHSDLGFPAGKHKTIMIDISDLARSAERLRLRTNLEIYWDWLGHAGGAEFAEVRTTRLAPARADLRYRGFSQTELVSARGPEVPVYDALANTRQRWRDLEGYHTRFGDVRELLAGIDDRYVIMNAGDELRFAFPALPPPGDGWTRDFVLIGDGWVKDGDYNTRFSKTVGPLPSHGQPEYLLPPGGPALEADPVYRRHSEDWQRFHTRYVTPRTFLDGLGREAR